MNPVYYIGLGTVKCEEMSMSLNVFGTAYLAVSPILPDVVQSVEVAIV